MSCLLTKFQLLSRRQFLIAPGLPVVGSGGFPWVCSKTVPQNRYWLVWAVSLLAGNVSAGFSPPTPSQLIVIPNGINPPLLAAGSDPDDKFFLNYVAVPNRAYGPGIQGLRVDRWSLGSGGNPASAYTHPGDEQPMLVDPILLSQGETLMGQSMQWGTPSDATVYLEMRYCYSEMLNTEDFQW